MATREEGGTTQLITSLPTHHAWHTTAAPPSDTVPHPIPTLEGVDPLHLDTLNSIHQLYQHIADPRELLRIIQHEQCLLPPGVTYADMRELVNKGWTCPSCANAKQRHKPTSKSTNYDKEQQNKSNDLELHVDVCGPFDLAINNMTGEERLALGDKRYMLLIVERNSRAVLPIPVANKSDCMAKLQAAIALIQALSHKRVVTMQSDGGGEFSNHKLEAWARAHCIALQRTPPHESNMNALVERCVRTTFAALLYCNTNAAF